MLYYTTYNTVHHITYYTYNTIQYIILYTWYGINISLKSIVEFPEISELSKSDSL